MLWTDSEAIMQLTTGMALGAGQASKWYAMGAQCLVPYSFSMGDLNVTEGAAAQWRL